MQSQAIQDGRYKVLTLTNDGQQNGLCVLEMVVYGGRPLIPVATISTTAASNQKVWRPLDIHQLERLQTAGADFFYRQIVLLPNDLASVWRELYGNVRPVIHTAGNGMRFVAAGSRVFYSNPKGKPWKYFADFLKAFAEQTFGREWILEETKKPQEKQHQIVKFHGVLYGELKNAPQDEQRDYMISPCGTSNYLLNLAYDLYILQDNGALPARLVDRLKQKDQFQGARHEVFAAATCIRAGFKITYEDERNGMKKPTEFIATHPGTGLQIAVEAKSRHRAGILDANVPGKRKMNPKAEIIQLLNQALAKSVNLPYVIFVDLNLPLSQGPVFQTEWFQEINRAIFKNLGTPSQVKRDKFNVVVFTNHPLHYGESDQPSPAIEPALCLFSQYPVHHLSNQTILHDLNKAAQLFGVIPRGFPITPWKS